MTHILKVKQVLHCLPAATCVFKAAFHHIRFFIDSIFLELILSYPFFFPTPTLATTLSIIEVFN